MRIKSAAARFTSFERLLLASCMFTTVGMR